MLFCQPCRTPWDFVCRALWDGVQLYQCLLDRDFASHHFVEAFPQCFHLLCGEPI